MALDPVLNFAKVTVSTGYAAGATSIALSAGHGAKLPNPAADGSFNLVWWNYTDYPNPTDDPNVEIVRCTVRSTDTLTVTRGQESTADSAKNTAAKTYKMILAITKKMIDDIETDIGTAVQGDTGVTGLTGDTGVAGAKGDTGVKGDTGSGLQGDTGITGDTGTAGADGDTGIQGDTGAAGSQGDTGVKGDTGTGTQGDTGVTGDTGTGTQGDTGIAGTKGDTGDAGDTGLTGAKGDTGEQGDTGIQGLQGDTGLTGSKGDTGTQGDTGTAGAKGDTGTTGSKGDTGTEGDTGVQGDTGADSTVKGDTGTQGDTGTSGAKGDTGTAGAKGDTGTQGDTGTWNLQLAENDPILLDSALSADGKYSGLVIAGTAGATLAFGNLCYLDPTDSRWEKTDANSAAAADGDARGVLGLCVLAAANDGDATKMLLWGNIRADTAFPTFTINNPVYVSETAGEVTGTQPTTTDAVIRVIGFGFTADSLFFIPSSDYITHT